MHIRSSFRTGCRSRTGGCNSSGTSVSTRQRLAARKEPRRHHPTRRTIKHALAAPGCAAAHSVRTIARAGVIDHLVATPVRLWVITAIDWRVSREELLHILAAVADNTTAVWDWAPPGTPVRGCLVLGGERRQARTRYDYGKGPVVVHTPGTLARELSAEGRALTRARRARRRRGGQARTGVRIARFLDATSACGPRGRLRAPVSNPPLRPLAVVEKASITPSLAHEQGFTPRERGFLRGSAPSFNGLRAVEASGPLLEVGSSRSAVRTGSAPAPAKASPPAR